MNKIYYGLNNRVYTPSSLLFQGGEGKIYTILEDSSLVIKIYHPTKLGNKLHLNNELENKIEFMVANPLRTELNDQIAWPLDVLRDEKGLFVGYSMLKISNTELLSRIYFVDIKSKTNRLELPWSNKIKIAKNLCTGVHILHKAGNIIGDFSPNNFGINPQSLKVVFMGTDAYHLVSNTHSYRCENARADYIAPEILQQILDRFDLKTASLPTFTFQTDYFALAIHIFQLLMGAHPYVVALLPTDKDVVRPSVEDNILQGQTGYFDLPDGLTHPLYSPSILVLPKPIQDLFIRAFITGTKQPSIRPNDEEWYDALALLEQDLTQCSSNPLHQYPSHNTNCPWCSIKKI
jgi:DNA-binding helix-hairpin-helix protein with protein kinase domain